ALLALGWLAGFSPGFLLAAGVVFLILSLLTMGSAVKPRHELKPIRTLDRFAMAGALLAVFAIHGYGVLWASAQLV
ncbi:MAG: site-2 protease family protein, partial [Mesorhizobium sp.]